MREPLNRERLHRFMRELGKRCHDQAQVYIVGGASAIEVGWRESTIDVDLAFVPENDELFRAIVELKELLNVNVELASPAHFIPELPGWEERSPFITREGSLSFHHYDFYAQFLAKIERGHERDLDDARQMVALGLVDRSRAQELFDTIRGQLYRYPAISPVDFSARLVSFLASLSDQRP